ncbi:MAG: DUF4348 domain-containing protein [Bacteroidales bacterium]|nr:DUF4348 domain-containing protein [Bacteroidales bacterium]
MKKIAAIILLSVFIISCSNNSKKDNTDASNENKAVDTIVSDPAPTNDEIQAFIDQFSTDSVFQMAHIKFPVKKIYPDQDMNLINDLIDKENWEIIDIRYDSAFYYRQYSSYGQKFIIIDDTLNISHVGLNCGINFGYKFVRKNEEWILFEAYDHSN